MVKKQKGGAIIGKGLSGTVHYPALQCKDSSQTPVVGNYVSKVSKKEIAEKEFNNTSKLRSLENAKNFAIFPEFMCEYDDRHNLLFSKFGGYSLDPFYEYMKQLSRSKNIKEVEDFDESYYNNVIIALKELEKNVKYMNENGIYHGDMGTNNMIYDEINNKLYLIDFDRGSRPEDDSLGINDIIYDLESYKKKIIDKKKSNIK